MPVKSKRELTKYKKGRPDSSSDSETIYETMDENDDSSESENSDTGYTNNNIQSDIIREFKKTYNTIEKEKEKEKSDKSNKSKDKSLNDSSKLIGPIHHKKYRKIIYSSFESDEDDSIENTEDEKEEYKKRKQRNDIGRSDKNNTNNKIYPENNNKGKRKEKGQEKEKDTGRNRSRDRDHGRGIDPKKSHSDKKKSKRIIYSDSEVDSDIDSDDESNTSTSEDSTSSSRNEETNSQKYNIILSIGGVGNDDYDDENDSYSDFKEEEEVGSDDEKTFMKENYKEVKIPEEEENDSECSSSSNKKRKSKRKHHNAYLDSPSSKEKEKEKDMNPNKKIKKDKSVKEESSVDENTVEKDYLELIELKNDLIQRLHKKKNSSILRKAINECKECIHSLIKETRKKNTDLYRKLVMGEKKTNEMDYFKKNLSHKEQLHIMRDLKEINKHIYVDKPYRLQLLQSSIPPKLKAIAMQKLNMLKTMEPGDSEYHKIKNWVDTFMKIPFGVHKNLSVNINDGLDVCNTFIQNAKTHLDNCVYGLEDAKLQIMQMIGQWISNPSSIGTAIAIKGPPGTGKTSLVKEGISKILGREFAFIALGGAGDSSFLEGHSYTYEGSTWGKIVQILIDSKCMNPVIYFDELDKISESARGQEIVGILTHLTDTSQNSQYHDKYFSEVDFDLSKCLFIFSYNNEELINPILRDRMYCIQTKGYDTKEKVIIARNYLLPKIQEQVNFKEGDIIIPDETLKYIINTTYLTKNENGVRNLKRCLEIIYTKLNLFRLIKNDNNLFEKQMGIKVTFPFTVLKNHIDFFIKNNEPMNQTLFSMYV